MLLRITRTGGIAGLQKSGELPVSRLSADELDAVDAVMGRGEPSQRPMGADMYRYVVKLVTSNGAVLHSVELWQDDMPAALASLLNV